MEFVNDPEFNKCVESFKKLSLKDKKKMIENNLQEILAFLVSLNKKNNKDVNILFNRELIDLKKENSTEDDYSEAIYVYLMSIKELLAQYILDIERGQNG